MVNYNSLVPLRQPRITVTARKAVAYTAWFSWAANCTAAGGGKNARLHRVRAVTDGDRRLGARRARRGVRDRVPAGRVCLRQLALELLDDIILALFATDSRQAHCSRVASGY